MLGKSKGECKCQYKLDEASIHIDYALAPCKGEVSGWNVPRDTVLRLTMYPGSQQRFADLKLDLTKYTARRDDTFTTYYASRSEGIEYAVSSDGMVSSVSYIPASGNDHLRCNGFPQLDASIADHITFDEYGDLDFDNEVARLDSYAFALKSRNLNSYIVVYAGPVACPHEARSRANRARAYLINKRGLNPARITAIDGGHREQFVLRLYALPQGSDPPNLLTTIASSEARIVRNRRCARVR